MIKPNWYYSTAATAWSEAYETTLQRRGSKPKLERIGEWAVKDAMKRGTPEAKREAFVA
jgi:hypothetical protein